jgi:ABC-type sulfate transport system permease component
VSVGVGVVVALVLISLMVVMRGCVRRLRLVQGSARQADRDFGASNAAPLDFFDAN